MNDNSIRIISSELITETVKRMFLNANYRVPDDIYNAICRSAQSDERGSARNILNLIKENAETAAEGVIPICQDTGMAFVFAEIGQDVHITGGSFEEAVNEGVRRAYDEGFLRKSIVKCPLERVNTGDNTPAVIYVRIVEGDRIKLSAMPKGFGSENMSRLRMFNPSATENDIVSFVVDTVKTAGANPCPPIIVGVGIGGSFDYSAVISKKALLRPIGQYSEKYGELEKRLLKEINESGVGAQGLGGSTTALWVAVEGYPTHIAGLPVAVNISCHATRHMTETI